MEATAGPWVEASSSAAVWYSQAVRVLLVLHQQRLVDDGNPNALSGDPLFMEYPKPQPWVFPQFQKLPRVEILRQFVRPLGSGVEVGREKFCLHACEVPVPQVGAAEVPPAGVNVRVVHQGNCDRRRMAADRARP
jgi:hypothetical protein